MLCVSFVLWQTLQRDGGVTRLVIGEERETRLVTAVRCRLGFSAS